MEQAFIASTRVKGCWHCSPCCSTQVSFSCLAYSKTSLSSFTRDMPFQFYFGPLSLLLMLVTVSTAGLAVILKRPRFKKGWHAIHLANYAAFILAFFHSVTIGTDLTSPRSPLRPLWVLSSSPW